MFHLLGFERKARLFCDNRFMQFLLLNLKLGFERKARLFCDTIIELWVKSSSDEKLGFERKARLFCDGNIETKRSFSGKSLGFERKARLFCDRYKPW